MTPLPPPRGLALVKLPAPARSGTSGTLGPAAGILMWYPCLGARLPNAISIYIRFIYFIYIILFLSFYFYHFRFEIYIPRTLGGGTLHGGPYGGRLAINVLWITLMAKHWPTNCPLENIPT